MPDEDFGEMNSNPGDAWGSPATPNGGPMTNTDPYSPAVIGGSGSMDHNSAGTSSVGDST